MELELIIVQVNSKGDVIESVCIDSLERLIQVDPVLTILLDSFDPFCVLQLGVLLDDLNHDTHPLFEKHLTKGLALSAPLLICSKHDEVMAHDRLEEVVCNWVLVEMLGLSGPHFLDKVRVRNYRDNSAEDIHDD